MVNLNDAKNSVEETVNDTQDAAQRAARDGATAVQDEVHKLKSKFKANTEHLEDELRDAGDRFAEGAKKFGDAAAEQIREHPLAAVGVAVVAGMMLSRWMRRR